MKITCTQEKLKKAVERSERVITRNLTLPILNNILLRAEKNTLTISATNLEIGVHSSLSCKVEKEGEITLPAKVFLGILNNISSDTISLTTQDNTTIKVTSGSYSGELKGNKTEDFPIIPKVDKGKEITIKTKEITNALKQVVPFTAVSETRPEITGILFFKKEGDETLNLVSTDSFRLAEREIFLDKKHKDAAFSFIVPQKAAAEAIRILKDGEEVTLTVEENQIALSIPQNTLISRLIEGNYPDHSAFIPDSFKGEITVSRKDLIQAIRLVSLLSSKINDIHLTTRSEKNNTELIIHAQDPDLGENKTSLSVDLSGEDVDISFNWNYLLEGLQKIEGETVQLKFVDSSKPTLIRSASQNPYTYLVMPIRA